MARPPDPGPRMDPEALAVERLLRQLQQRNGGEAPPPLAPPRLRPAPSVATRGQARPARLSLPSIPGVWARIALGALLGAALTQWPYPGTCGAGAGLKVAATAVVVMAGIWGATRAWRRRMAGAHVIALLILAWGLALLTHEVLPRTRYASDPAPWACPTSQRALHASPPGAMPDPRPEASGPLAARV